MKTLVLITCLLCLNTNASFAQIEQDSLELVKFYNATIGAEWENSWDLTKPVKEWHGITFENNRVTWIALNYNGLGGTLPDLQLEKLEGLLIKHNQIQGIIPDFSGLPELDFLKIDNNLFSGSIPDFSNLPKLEYFDCYENQFTGELPLLANCPELIQLQCYSNPIEGKIPNYNLPKLRILNIGWTLISGSIPDFTNLPSIYSLNIHDSNISGTIPDFNFIPTLEHFTCLNNYLTGTIPDFFNLPILATFRCDVNQLEGSITDFSNLPKLAHYDCSENKLTGTIPDLQNCERLEVFRFKNNSITGEIPHFTNLPKLRSLYCSNNILQGSIPEFYNCPKLVSILCVNANLSGRLPQFIPDGILSIKCSDNNLSGCFPDYVCDIQTFESFNNPLMPWKGDHTNFCLAVDQVGAPCCDGDDLIEMDMIDDNCNCGSFVSSVADEGQELFPVLYPNPVTSMLNIELKNTDKYLYRLINSQGALLKEYRNISAISVSHLTAGLYYLEIVNSESTARKVQKVIISN